MTSVDIETLDFKEVRGYERLPPRVRNLVKEWAELHRTDLHRTGHHLHH